MVVMDCVVIIIGGVNGIGKVCVCCFSEDGCNVVIVDMDLNVGQVFVEELGLDKDKVLFVQCDVFDWLVVNNLFFEMCFSFDWLDILVNNVGVVVGGDIFIFFEVDFDKVMGVNFKGVFFVVCEVVCQMVDQIEVDEEWVDDVCCCYVIINMILVNVVMVIFDQLVYCVIKGVLIQMIKFMVLVLVKYGIWVNVIGLGSINIDVFKVVNDNFEVMDKIMFCMLLGWIGDFDEIVLIVFFLVLKDVSYMIGIMFYVDGGWMVMNYIVFKD